MGFHVNMNKHRFCSCLSLINCCTENAEIQLQQLQGCVTAGNSFAYYFINVTKAILRFIQLLDHCRNTWYLQCLDIVASRYVSLQSKLWLWTIPDFRMSAKIALRLFFLLIMSTPCRVGVYD